MRHGRRSVRSGTDEQALLKKAIERVEAALDVGIPPTCTGPPWICTKILQNGHAYYVAGRVNVTETFEGRSAAEIRRKMHLSFIE